MISFIFEKWLLKHSGYIYKMLNSVRSYLWGEVDEVQTYVNGQLSSHIVDGNNIPAIIKPNGDKHWYEGGLLHSYIDASGKIQPAIISSNGDRYYYIAGKDVIIHNDEVIYTLYRANGDKELHKNGRPHSFIHKGEYLPAIVKTNGDRHWCNEGNLFCFPDNDTVIPSMITATGIKYYHKQVVGVLRSARSELTSFEVNGKLIPSIVHPGGLTYWCNNGKPHSFIHNGKLMPAVMVGGDKMYKKDGVTHCFIHNNILYPSSKHASGKKMWCNELDIPHCHVHNGVIHPSIIDEEGNKLWMEGKRYECFTLGGRLLPSKVLANGDKLWTDHTGVIHSPVFNGELLPGMIKVNGDKGWYYHGKIHSYYNYEGRKYLPEPDKITIPEIMPGVIKVNGIKLYYENGVQKNLQMGVDGSPHPYKINANGDKFYKPIPLNVVSSKDPKYWFKDGKFHNIGSKHPSIIRANGDKAWTDENGKYTVFIHDGFIHPSLVCANGDIKWLNADGYAHSYRIDDRYMPAIIRANGIVEMRCNGLLHSIEVDNEYILPAILYPDGKADFYKNGIIILTSHIVNTNELKITQYTYEETYVILQDQIRKYVTRTRLAKLSHLYLH